VCAAFALVPATGVAGATAATTQSPEAGTAAVSPKPAGVRKRLRTSLSVSHVRRNVLAGRSATIRGALRPGLKGQPVRLQVRQSWGYKTVDRTRTGKNGTYRFTLKARRPGTLTLRVVFPGNKVAHRSQRTAGRLNVFRQAFASWYNDYGSPLACGGTLGYSQLGVAHKTLPCGTKLTLRYRGRSVRVRVIDRGPFVGGREFDLTGATKRALGFGDLGTVLATR
jgi:hypothetical protein